jgi:hypothetical protein
MLPIEPHEVAAAKKQSSPNNENEGACDGDSGGPLVHNNALIGVTSRGAKECGRAQAPHNNLPTIFVRADFITVWLDEKIAEELEKEPLPPGLPEDLRGVCFEPFGPDVICAYGGSFGYTNMNFEPYFTGWSVSQGLTKVHETTTTITVVPNSFSGTREHVLVYFGDYDDYIHFQVCNPDDIKLYIDGPDIVCGTQAFHVNNPNRFPIQWSIDPPDSEFELVSQGYFWAEVKNCDHDGQAEAMLIVTLNVKGTDIVVEKEIRACDTRKMEIIGPRDIEIPYYPVTYEIKDLPPGRNIVWDWRFYRDLLTTTISLPPAELEDVVILGTTNPDLIPEGEENSPILSKSEILGLLDGFEEDEIVGNDDHESDYILVKRLRVMMNPEHIGQPREESKIEANVRMVGCDELNLKPLTVYVGEKPKNEIRISYSPNPTANELIVEFINEHADTWTETDDSELNYSVKLYDNAGVVKRQTNHRRRKRDRESSVKFSISNLQEGTYYLHIESDGELEKHQIIVTK